MESSPPPQEDEGYNFVGPWGTLNFYLPLGVLTQMGGLKSFTLFFWEGGQQGFLGGWGSPSPTGQKFTHPSPTRNSPPVDSPPNFYYPPPKVHPPLNSNFHVINQ